MGGCGSDSSNNTGDDDDAALDGQLKELIDTQGIQGLPALDPPVDKNSPLVKLGKTLFFEKLIGAENDTACSTCHLPTRALQNASPLPIGAGGSGTGPDRTWSDGSRAFQWRNSPSIINRALPLWKAVTFDSQVQLDAMNKPTGVPIVYDISTVDSGMLGVLEIHAHFPPSGRDVMLGLPNAHNGLNQGDAFQLKSFNPLDPVYASPLEYLEDVWAKLTARIMSHPEYKQMFADAYPGVAASDITFLHIGRALATFESAYFVFRGSPWLRYLDGDKTAMTKEAKQGAQLFFTRGCTGCHTGPLFTDQEHHNIGVLPFGVGPEPSQLVTTNPDLTAMAADVGFPITDFTGPHLDVGIAEFENGADFQRDLFAFRTISLHNVELSAPYFHNGTYQDLKSVVKHHLDAEADIDAYDTTYLHQWLDKVNGPNSDHPELRVTTSAKVIEKLKSSIDPRVLGSIKMTDAEVDMVVEFLKSLTDPALKDLSTTLGTVTTPSGLPVDM